MNNRDDWKCADADVLASLRGEESGASKDAKARVFQRLAAGLGASVGTSDGDEATAPGGSADAGAATSVGAATGARLGAVVGLGRPSVLALAFALGGGVGAAGYAMLAQPPAPRIVYVDRVITTPEVAVTTDDRAPAAVPAPSAAAPAGSIDALPKRDRDVSREVARGSAGAAKGAALADLAAQQALLDEARASFGQGANDAALRTIALHERRYPDSVLTEEREALAIKALVASRNYEKAKSMGARFAERYPRSLLLPAVRDALGSIP